MAATLKISLILIPLLCMVSDATRNSLKIILSQNELFPHRLHPLRGKTGVIGQTLGVLSSASNGQLSLNSQMGLLNSQLLRALSYVSIIQMKCFQVMNLLLISFF